MSTVDVNGTTIHYERRGRGPATLFVHGAFGDADVWADQDARVGDARTVVRYDRRGHSRSARGDRAVDYRLHADDAAALIDALGLAPCLLVGSSAGAAIAVDVARRHGHLLRGVVLSEPPLFSLDAAAGAAARAELASVIDGPRGAEGPRAAVDAFMDHMCPGLWGAIDEHRKDAYRANADIGFEDIAAPPLVVTPEDVAAITVPALVFGAETSRPYMRSIARALASALPDARFVELAGSGHVTYAERPVEFAAAVAAFADEVDRRRGRIDVRSTDGTSIAVWRSGASDGVPVVLVHGTLNDHNGFDDLVAALGDDADSYAIDRRGYGASGDGEGAYRVEREFADVAVVVDAIAERRGRDVALLGHSYGANCALGAATLTSHVDRLILYEGSLGLDYPPGAVEKMDAALETGDREAVLRAVLAPLELSGHELDAICHGPRGPVLLAGAANGPREARAERDWSTGYAAFSGVEIPTLLLSGDESPPTITALTRQAAAAIPGATVRVLAGHAHLAHRTDPELVADIIREFVGAAAASCR